MTTPATLQPGRHRPIYLWAGPGTIRMNRLKFMNAAVDEQIHLEAHASAGVRRVVDETGCNWVYLAYNWGFPPELEVEDWDSFSEAAKAYHAAGAKVFAYIQTSNCVNEGSFKNQDWYAQDARDRRIHYYTGRYMTCWQHPAWIAHLERMIFGATQRGADGIFFDNPWYAAQPVHMFGAWHGPAGCYCPRCQQKYLQETGQPIPTRIDPGDPLSDTYIRWRANQVTLTLAYLSGYAKGLSPDIPISVNNFDAVMRPAYLIYGIDLKSLAEFQDILMIEDYGLPRFDRKPQPRLANNALTIHTARALAKETPISVDPYDQGIGFDSVFPTRRYLQGIAEATAGGAAMVIKGTEFVDRGIFTLLTAPQFYETRREIGRYHDWLEAHTGLLEDRNLKAPVALLHPGDRLWQDWSRLAPLFFGAGQTLLAAGIPWKVVVAGDTLEGIQALVVCDGPYRLPTVPRDLPILSLTDLAGWDNRSGGGLVNRAFSRPAGALIDAGYRAYFNSAFARRMMDRAGVMRLFTGSPLFNLPNRTQQSALLAALPAGLYPRVHAQAPVLAEAWQRDGVAELHLVNYAPQSQIIRVEFANAHPRQILSPDHSDLLLPAAASIEITIDIYDVIVSHEFDNLV
jgi:hypothetical protein